jgi:hypothetical protein
MVVWGSKFEAEGIDPETLKSIYLCTRAVLAADSVSQLLTSAIGACFASSWRKAESSTPIDVSVYSGGLPCRKLRFRNSGPMPCA